MLRRIFLLIFSGAWLRWIWTDDKTGKHSDTTLRMNLLFIAMFIVLINAIIRLLISDKDINAWMPHALSILTFIAPITGGGAMAYAYKRWNEARNNNGQDF